jgi:hypothetical protein
MPRDPEIKSWRDEFGTLRCNATERTYRPTCATIIFGDCGGGAVFTRSHRLVKTEAGLVVIMKPTVQPGAPAGA